MNTKINSRIELPSEVLRNLSVLYSTPAGTVVGDREFGIDMSLQDLPIHSAQVSLIAEYTTKTKLYEPRAKVSEVHFGYTDDGILESKVVIDWN